MNQHDHGTTHINWNQIFALAALDASILISWLAYHEFQPKLLQKFHFDHLHGFVLYAQSFVILLVPLLAGGLADYLRKKNFNTLLVYAVGISVASMIFMTVSYTISDNAFQGLTGLLPIMIVLWLISMNVFHSPANSILEEFSQSPRMPLVMSVISIASVLVYISKPLILKSLDMLGGSITFLIGGLVLVITGIWFGKATRTLVIGNHHVGEQEPNRFHIVVMAGLITGLANSLILHFFPAILETKFGAVETIFDEYIYVSAMLCVTAIATLPLSSWAQKRGIYPSFVISVFTSFISMLIILLSPWFWLSMVGSLFLALSYGVLLITSFPHALRNINPASATFGTGIFFACFEFFEVLFTLISPHH